RWPSRDGRDGARAPAWRSLRPASPPAAPSSAPPALPDEALPPAVASGWVDGYLAAIEWRPVRGRFPEPGHATVWARMRYPLVPDEETGPLERVLAVADSGNGVSSELDLRRWRFINPELTVHLHREAAGEWICLDARTVISTGGAGPGTSAPSHPHGPGGGGPPSLLVTPRRPHRLPPMGARPMARSPAEPERAGGGGEHGGQRRCRQRGEEVPDGGPVLCHRYRDYGDEHRQHLGGNEGDQPDHVPAPEHQPVPHAIQEEQHQQHER